MSSYSDRLDHVSREQPHTASQPDVNSAIKETYLSHPVFGLLVKLCIIDTHSALYTSLYAKRLFFLVIAHTNGLEIDSISRDAARISLEKRLAVLRKSNFHHEYEQLKDIYKSTFNR